MDLGELVILVLPVQGDARSVVQAINGGSDRIRTCNPVTGDCFRDSLSLPMITLPCGAGYGT